MTDAVLQSVNNVFEVSWGRLSSDLGVLYSLQKELQEDARSVKLSWVGNGILFDVSTDNGKTWETVENGKITRLKNPGRKIVVKALLPIDSNTFLDNYILEINPAGYSLFTGKVLDESTGLVYFGARWYDPEVGRFISVDPAEDGENWYALCGNDPVNYFDTEGLFKNGWQILQLGYGMLEEAAIMSIIGVVAVVATPYIAPAMPVLVPIFTALAIGTAINDIAYLSKNFTQVFFGNPTDAQCRMYGRSLTRIFATITFSIFAIKGCQSFDKFIKFKKFWGKAGDGWQWHHIVEQNPANKTQFGERALQNIFNILKLPSGSGSIHTNISAHYSSKPFFAGGKTVRGWLSGKSFIEQYTYGVKILIKALFGRL